MTKVYYQATTADGNDDCNHQHATKEQAEKCAAKTYNVTAGARIVRVTQSGNVCRIERTS